VKPALSYDNVNYVNAFVKINVGCQLHDNFFITPHDLLKGRGCPKCSKKYRKTNSEFIDLAKIVFPLYSYEYTLFVNNKTKVKITCNIHGDFHISPQDLLSGHGCSKCKNVYKPTTEEFIAKVKIIFPKYDFSLVNYINSKTKISVICKAHGLFKIAPFSLLKGHGCSKCFSSLKEEICRFIFEFFTSEIWAQSREDWNINPITNRKLQLDGYCSKLCTAFEYDGPQHSQVMRFDKSKNRLAIRQNLDRLKDTNCINNNVKLIRIPYSVEYNDLFSFIEKELIKNNIKIVRTDIPSINYVKSLIKIKIEEKLC
jgi:hypothetical protein